MSQLAQSCSLLGQESSSDRPMVSRRGERARLLLIDDELETWRTVRVGLTRAAFELQWTHTATQGLDLATRWHPDVVLLELSLPDMDGLEACHRLRTWSQVPLIILSVRASDTDKVVAFEEGADDYLTKPFSMVELAARVRVALRHAAHPHRSASGACFQTHGLAIDFERRRVSVHGVEVRLTPTEYAVLKYLAMHVGKVVTHCNLLRAVWGPAYEDAVHYLHVFIAQMRRKLEPKTSRPYYLLTEPGIGYRLRSED